ncbi:MAG: ATP-binding protein [archaeon]
MKKYVITGGPCSGKSTLIKRIKEKGYSILEEIARKIILERKEVPLTSKEQAYRQRLILSAQVREELILNSEFVFLDRSIIDNFAYQNYLLGGIIQSSVEETKDLPRYDKIFFLERLPFEKDGLRIEKGDSEAEEIHNEIFKQYKLRGYNPVKVPVMDIDSRTGFVLKHIKKQNGLH